MLRKLSRQLLAKSEDAFLLALEIYNKPTVDYRLESFCILFINSWELLLKAYLIEEVKNTKIIFLKGTKQQETISFTEALGRAITDTKSPIRINLEDINKLRNTSSHLIIPEYEIIYTGLFQQGVLNYVKALSNWFDRSINITPRLLTLAFEYQPTSITKLTLKDKYNKMILSAFDSKQKEIMETIKENPTMYSIPINSTLALVKNPNKADIVLSKGLTGKEFGVIEVAKDHDRTHPYLRGKDKSPKVGTLLYYFNHEDIAINGYDITCINYSENINETTRTEFVYKSKVANSSAQYSQEYINFIIRKINNNPKYIEKCRKKYQSKSN